MGRVYVWEGYTDQGAQTQKICALETAQTVLTRGNDQRILPAPRRVETGG